jgi:hypothetical protein
MEQNTKEHNPTNQTFSSSTIASQYCIKSILSCGNEDVRKAVQLVVEQVSKTASLGNAVFTMVALSFFHDHPKKSFPKEFLSQSTFTACLRSVRLKTLDLRRPLPVELKTDSADPTIKASVALVLTYVRQAQEKLISLKTDDGEPWPCLPSFGQTFNQSARAYRTSLTNNLFMHASKRLQTVIKAEVGPRMDLDTSLKPSRSYIINVVFRTIVGAKIVTNIDSYKNHEEIRMHAVPFLQSAFVLDLIKEHQEWLQDAVLQLKNVHPTQGILSEKNIEDHPHLYLGYQLFLAERLESIRALEEQKDQKRRRSTFQIIPQLTMKARCVTFGKEQTTELLYCCCHVEATKMRTEKYKRRATVLKCTAKHVSNDGTGPKTSCGNMLGRDENAAHNILYIFQAQNNGDGTVPSAFRPRCTSSKKTLIGVT